MASPPPPHVGRTRGGGGILHFVYGGLWKFHFTSQFMLRVFFSLYFFLTSKNERVAPHLNFVDRFACDSMIILTVMMNYNLYLEGETLQYSSYIILGEVMMLT